MSQNEPVRPVSGIACPSHPTPVSCENEATVKYALPPVIKPISFDAEPTDDKGGRSLMPGDCVELVSVRADIDAIRSRCRAEYGDTNGAHDYPFWLHFAFDLSTYSMLAADFDIFPPDDYAWRCILAMCGTDKDSFAELVGARRNWKTTAVPRFIITDESSVFRSDAFRDAIVLLGASHVVRPGGNRRSLSAINSMIRYIIASIMRSDDLSEWINPAIMPIEYAIGTAIVRAVIDHYQAEPMQGLSGKCPDTAWHDTCKLYGAPRLLTEGEVSTLLDVARFEDRLTQS